MKKTYAIAAFYLFIATAAFKFPGQYGYKIGDNAIDFTLKNVDENKVSLADYKNAKGFIVIFTCNHCPFSQAYEQRIIDLHKKYEPKGFPVIAINPNDKDREPDDSFENMQKLAKEKNYPFAYLYDETQEIAKAYGATRTPHVFILQKSKKGNLVKYIGAIDDNYEDASAAKEKYAEQAVDALLSGKSITTAQTKAIGCGIKWKKQ
ncbi:MAG: thioredoxin family protein [Bacteroidota bacterium]|jgi:peroxiredoxin|nr:thioredoxin family protein [Sphingobacteriales bacterium]